MEADTEMRDKLQQAQTRQSEFLARHMEGTLGPREVPESDAASSSSPPVRSGSPSQPGLEASHRVRINSESSPEQPAPKRVRVEEAPQPPAASEVVEEDENPLPPAGEEGDDDEPEAKRTRLDSSAETSDPIEPHPDEVGLIASVSVFRLLRYYSPGRQVRRVRMFLSASCRFSSNPETQAWWLESRCGLRRSRHWEALGFG